MVSFSKYIFPGLAGVAAVQAGSILFQGGTIVTFNESTQAVEVLRDTSILVTDDRVTALFPAVANGSYPVPNDTEVVSAVGKIITPGFIDTHRHLWQSQYRTIASNTTLLEYFSRYAPQAAFSSFTPEDISLSQTIGIWESLNAGVTSIVDHAHASFSRDAVEAAWNASVESGGRIFFCYSFGEWGQEDFAVQDQWAHYRELIEEEAARGGPATLGASWDFWRGSPRDVNEAFVELVSRYPPSVFTTHYVGGIWSFSNSPSLLHSYNFLNTSLPIIFSHATYADPVETNLLRQTAQHISVTPESEMHYGHDHPTSHLMQDVASLGVDTHFTYSADIISQARLWLQVTRRGAFRETLEDWRIPSTNPMSINQAFILATRNGARALRRADLGLLAPGAKADIVVFDTSAPNLIGWEDPVAAVMLHANVGDIEHVLVDGAFRKRDFELVTNEDRAVVESKFRESARRIQAVWRETPLPEYPAVYAGSGVEIGATERADVLLGEGDGY